MLHAKMLGGLTRSLLKNKIGHGQARGNALIATRSRTARNLTWEYGSYSKKEHPESSSSSCFLGLLSKRVTCVTFPKFALVASLCFFLGSVFHRYKKCLHNPEGHAQ